MARHLAMLAILTLGLGAADAGQIDPSRLRAQLSTPYSFTIGIDFTRMFTGERIVADPKTEIARLERKLTGKQADAPLHLEMADLYAMLNHGQSGSPYSDQVAEHSKLAAEQYKSLLAKKPDDPVLLLGYANALWGTGKGGDDLAIPVLRKLIAAHPSAWEARLDLAEILDSDAAQGLMAATMLERIKDSPDAIRMRLNSDMPKPLTQEEADKLLREAVEQRDLAVKHAPKASGAYLGRFSGRFGSALNQLLMLGAGAGQFSGKDKAATLRLIRAVADPADLRKAWQLDPQNATVLRSLVFIEIGNIILDQTATRSSKEFLSNILAQNPAERTWKTIPAPDKARLAQYEVSVEKSIRENPKDVWAAYEALGLLKAFQGERQAAVNAFRMAARICCAADISYVALFMDAMEGLPKDAPHEEQARKAIPIWEMRSQLSGGAADLLNLASMYATSERLDKAEETARKVLKSDPGNRSAYHILGVVILKRQGDVKEAISHLERALAPKDEGTSVSYSTSSSDDTTDRMQLNLGIAYAIAGDITRARQALEKVGGDGEPHGKAAELLKELEVGPGHVIYGTAEDVYVDAKGVLTRYPSREVLKSFTAPAGSIVITPPASKPDFPTLILAPGAKVDPADAPRSEYEIGRIIVKHSDGTKAFCPEGSRMEVLTAPRTFGSPG